MKKVALSNLCSIAGGIPAPKETSLSGDIPFVRMRELGDAHLTPNFVPSDEFLTKHDEKVFSAKIIQPGATLFPRSGSVHLNHRALLRTPAVIVSHIAALIPNEQTDPEFLYHLLTSYDMTEIMTQTTGLNMIKFGQLKDVIFSVPDTKPEQSKIAEILSTVDRAIEQTEALIAKQQRIKTGLMQDLLTRGIDEHGNLRSEATHKFKDSPLGRIPVEWETLSLGQSGISIIDGDRGKHYPHEDEFSEDGYCLFLSATNVTKRGFNFTSTQFITKDKDNKLRSGKLCRGDVVITTRGTVGNIAYYDDSIPFSHIRINSGMVILRSEQPVLNQEFLYIALQNYVFEHEYKRVVSGSAQPQLPLNDLIKFNILLPEPKEQQTITCLANAIQDHLFTLEEQLSKLRRLKTALMQDLLTGRRRVTALLEQQSGASA